MKHDQIESMIPLVMRSALTNPMGDDGNPLNCLLKIMELFHDQIERAYEQLPGRFNPEIAAHDMVHYLASWVDLKQVFSEEYVVKTREPTSPFAKFKIDNLRELVVQSSTLWKWRGTQKGMLLFLSIATGQEGFEIRDTDQPFHMSVVAPNSCLEYDQLIRSIIESEKPAHVTCELSYAE